MHTGALSSPEVALDPRMIWSWPRRGELLPHASWTQEETEAGEAPVQDRRPCRTLQRTREKSGVCLMAVAPSSLPLPSYQPLLSLSLPLPLLLFHPFSASFSVFLLSLSPLCSSSSPPCS